MHELASFPEFVLYYSVGEKISDWNRGQEYFTKGTVQIVNKELSKKALYFMRFLYVPLKIQQINSNVTNTRQSQNLLSVLLA